jgi:hypothetical protein
MSRKKQNKQNKNTFKKSLAKVSLAGGLAIGAPVSAISVAGFWNSQEFATPLGNVQLAASTRGQNCPYSNNNHSYASNSGRGLQYGIKTEMYPPQMYRSNYGQATQEEWESLSKNGSTGWVEAGFLAGSWTFYSSSHPSRYYQNAFWANKDKSGFFRHKIDISNLSDVPYIFTIYPSVSPSKWYVHVAKTSGSHYSKSTSVFLTSTKSNVPTRSTQKARFGIELTCNSQMVYGHDKVGGTSNWAPQLMMKKVKTGSNTYSYQKYSKSGFTGDASWGKPTRSIHNTEYYEVSQNNKAYGEKFFVKAYY